MSTNRGSFAVRGIRLTLIRTLYGAREHLIHLPRRFLLHRRDNV